MNLTVWPITQSGTNHENSMKTFSYFLFNKPYSVLCQFTGKKGRKTLGDYLYLPPDIYPVGRLDADSEGLVLLTNDGKTAQRLLNPKFCHPRTYLVQVERIPLPGALQKLRGGVIIEGKKTLPAVIKLLENEPDIPARPVPVRFRLNVPTAWLEITLYEGRNRQIRKMTAAVGHPTLRLLRIGIGGLKLDRLQPGRWRELTRREIIEFKKTSGLTPE